MLMRMLTYKNLRLKWNHQRSMRVMCVGLSVVPMVIAIAYHTEYLDELDLTLVAKELAENFDRNTVWKIFFFCVCKNFLNY